MSTKNKRNLDLSNNFYSRSVANFSYKSDDELDEENVTGSDKDLEKRASFVKCRRSYSQNSFLISKETNSSITSSGLKAPQSGATAINSCGCFHFLIKIFLSPLLVLLYGIITMVLNIMANVLHVEAPLRLYSRKLRIHWIAKHFNCGDSFKASGIGYTWKMKSFIQSLLMDYLDGSCAVSITIISCAVFYCVYDMYYRYASTIINDYELTCKQNNAHAAGNDDGLTNCDNANLLNTMIIEYEIGRVQNLIIVFLSVVAYFLRNTNRLDLIPKFSRRGFLFYRLFDSEMTRNRNFEKLKGNLYKFGFLLFNGEHNEIVIFSLVPIEELMKQSEFLYHLRRSTAKNLAFMHVDKDFKLVDKPNVKSVCPESVIHSSDDIDTNMVHFDITTSMCYDKVRPSDGVSTIYASLVNVYTCLTEIRPIYCFALFGVDVVVVIASIYITGMLIDDNYAMVNVLHTCYSVWCLLLFNHLVIAALVGGKRLFCKVVANKDQCFRFEDVKYRDNLNKMTFYSLLTKVLIRDVDHDGAFEFSIFQLVKNNPNWVGGLDLYLLLQFLEARNEMGMLKYNMKFVLLNKPNAIPFVIYAAEHCSSLIVYVDSTGALTWSDSSDSSRKEVLSLKPSDHCTHYHDDIYCIDGITVI